MQKKKLKYLLTILKRKTSSKLGLSLVFLYLCGCASESNQAIEVVSLDGSSEIKVEKEASGFGPAPHEQSPDTAYAAESLSIPKPTVGLALIPALYHSIYYLELFVLLDQFKQPYFVITSGYSALVCAIYGLNQSYNQSKWLLFRLEKLIGDEKPFSPEWYRIVDKFIDSHFKGKKISQLGLPLAVPILNNSVKIDYSSDLPTLLKRTMRLNSSEFQVILSANSFTFQEEFKSLRIKKSFQIGLLPERFQLSRRDDYMFSVYGKLSWLLKEEGLRVNQNQSIYLDQHPPLSEESFLQYRQSFKDLLHAANIK